MPDTPHLAPDRPLRRSDRDAAMWEVVRAEMVMLLDHDDGYYAHRLQRGIVLERYEEAVLAHVLRTVEPGDAHVFEIGAGWGPLCIALGALGYPVTAFNGEPVYVEDMKRIVDAAARIVPAVGRNVEIRLGFFPYGLNRDDLPHDRRTVLISTNIVNDVNRTGQDAMIAAALQFDHFIVDVATFAHDRDESGRTRLRDLLAFGFTTQSAVWEGRMLDLRARPERAGWSAARPPAPDWLFDGAPVAEGAGPLDLADVWGTLALREELCWTLRLPEAFAGVSDSMEAPSRSPFRLREDGALLGPPHALHDEIAHSGGGRYSHWKTFLLFSTSDGSDPRTNGRRYHLDRSVFSGTSD